MKKIALASAAMGGVALIAFGASGTFASFSSTETISNQKAGAATFELKVGGGAVTAGAENMSLAPGGSARYAYQVKNASALPGLLSAAVTVQDVENGRNDAEKAARDTNDGTGEFSKFAAVQAFYGGDGETCNVNAKQELGPVSTFQTVGQTISAGGRSPFELPAGQTHCVVLEVSLPTDDPDINQVQGDDAIFSLAFSLEQDTGSKVR